MKSLKQENFHNFLIYIYIVTLPLSGTMFTLVEINLGLLGGFSVIDLFRVLLIYHLNKIIVNKSDNKKDYQIIMVRQIIIIIVFIYVIKNIDLYNFSFIGFIKSSFKYFTLLYPLFLLIKKRSGLYFTKQQINFAVILSSVMVLSSIVFYEEILNLNGVNINDMSSKSLLIRQGGFFAFGDMNSLSAYQVTITAFYLCLFYLKFTNIKMVLISTLITIITITYTVSRGSMLSLTIIYLVFFLKDKMLIKKIQIIIVIGLLFLSLFIVFPYRFDAIKYRLFVDDVTERDLDYKGGEGRLYSYIYFYKEIVKDPKILILGSWSQDSMIRFGRQTVHNEFLKITLEGGIVMFSLFIMTMRRIYIILKRFRCSILMIPMLIASLTLPQSGVLIFIPILVLIIESNYNNVLEKKNY